MPASANLFIIPAQSNYEEFNVALQDRREAKKYIHLYIVCNLIAVRGNNGKNFIEGHLSAAVWSWPRWRGDAISNAAGPRRKLLK